MNIFRAEEMLAKAATSSEIFLAEAQGSRAYWKAVSFICKRDSAWKRVYPHATDELNILLNTGYTLLAKRVFTLLESARIMPELGFLHGNTSGDALVYDLMECFRQPLVDASLFPLFSRLRKHNSSITEKTFKRGFSFLTRQYDKRIRYHAKCETMNRIIALEIYRLKQSVEENKIWKPYQYGWGHSMRCTRK